MIWSGVNFTFMARAKNYEMNLLLSTFEVSYFEKSKKKIVILN